METPVFLLRRCLGQQLDRSPLGVEFQSALRAADPIGAVKQELAADQALEASAPENRDQLLVERAVQNCKRHSERNTPVTRPRIWTCAARIGWYASFSGWSRTPPLSRKNRFTVASSAHSSSPTSATTMSPSRASC